MGETEAEIFVTVFVVILRMSYTNIYLFCKQISQKCNINSF